MLYEYAVEPAAISSDRNTCRYLAELFGFDRGRLLSRYPKKWLRIAIEEVQSQGLPPIAQKRVIEKLKTLKDRASVSSGRIYDPALGGWLDNALTDHRREPFHAIIATANPNGDACILCGDEVDEQNALMACARERAVPRDVDSLATALGSMLRFGSRIVFVDPFFDPYNPRHKQLFFRLLSVTKECNPSAKCEIHYRFHYDKPANADLEREAANLFGRIIPEGMSITLLCWKERNGGEDFHARYLLTDKGGIRVDAGFDPVGAHQTTDIALMDYRLSQSRLQSVARDATTYELVGPVLRISASGEVEHA